PGLCYLDSARGWRNASGQYRGQLRLAIAIDAGHANNLAQLNFQRNPVERAPALMLDYDTIERQREVPWGWNTQMLGRRARHVADHQTGEFGAIGLGGAPLGDF